MAISTDTFIQLVLTGIAVVAFSLAIWILNSIHKRVSEITEDIKRAHSRITAIIEDRHTTWTNQKEDCGDEKSRITRVEQALKWFTKGAFVPEDK